MGGAEVRKWRNRPAWYLLQPVSTRRGSVNITRELFVRLPSDNLPPQPLRLLEPPAHLHFAEEGGGLVELLAGFGKIAFLVEQFGVADVGDG